MHDGHDIEEMRIANLFIRAVSQNGITMKFMPLTVSTDMRIATVRTTLRTSSSAG